MKIAKRIIKITAIVLTSIVALLLAFNLVLNVIYYDFFSNTESNGEVPGISDGFVQQGLDYCDGSFLVSGYMKDKSASRIYIMRDGETVGYTTLAKENGSPYTAHAGGVTHFGEYVYMAGSGSGTFDVFKLADVLDGGDAKLIGKVDSFNAPAWVTVYNNEYILAGSFAEAGNPDYPPEDYEKITTPAGDENVSLITVFKLDATKTESYGIDPTPVAVISSANKIQGAYCLDGGRIITSSSWSIYSSEFRFYNFDKETKGEITLDGATLPLYYLDSASLASTVKGLPMAEEIVVLGDDMYIMNESACGKYIFGNLIGGREFYSYKITDEHFKK